MDYITINDNFENTIEIKKSSFIGHLFSITSVEQGNEYIELIKKEHYKANHNTYGYILGKNMEVQKCSDDGEPALTAGKPILLAMENNNLTNALIVVTRYFGGIKLGAGGLIRAYSAAASEVIHSAKLVKKVYVKVIKISYEYPLHGKMEVFLRSTGFSLEKIEFLDIVHVDINIPIKDIEKFKNELIALTNNKIKIEEKEEKYIDEFI